jgi:hypothetical protein
MFHPLVTDLSGLSDEDLTKKIAELSGKISSAYRLGSASAVSQMQMIMNHYQEEYQRRSAKKLEELEKHSKNFKNIIDIK